MDKVTQIKSATLTDDLTQRLTAEIVEGVLPLGSKISEPELAKRYGVSRGPLREALVKLEALGLITRTANVGARVIELNIEDLLDIYTLREAMEGMAARLAAELISEEEVNELYKLLDDHQAHLDANQDEHYVSQYGNEDFHLRIIQASQNKKLIRALTQDLYATIRMYRRYTADSRPDPRQALREHKAILDAVANREGDLAELLMRRHISRAANLLKKAMLQNSISQGNTGQP
ncbi:GntR family transcriptional regulator [Marinomonas fungiae]|uniref:Transcriptional regulator, GntR family n=1 Tax=Marinomonas fungiae TaxID=1137284 RepID=A0A0K6IQI2_9GAMM|nr:GntR family transcriptional regulator [Marinomonas fungiae]CUB05353.1 transcriptional regulator, GntR family [Marinomonas fungiae]